MDIQRIIKENEITTILSLDDLELQKNVLDKLGCSKAEWVQNLIKESKIHDGNLTRIYGVLEGGKVKGYMIGQNCVAPPLYRFFIISYQNFFGLKDDNGKQIGLKALEAIKAWACECGAKKILIGAGNEEMARFYEIYAGFKRTAEINMELKL